MEGSFDVNFCKVLIKKSASNNTSFEQYDEPLIDVMDEEDNVRLLVQGRCLEQQVSIHVNKNKDGISICREKCHISKGSETVDCADVCSRKLALNIGDLQLENMLFIVSKCNNNNVLEITIPKVKHEVN